MLSGVSGPSTPHAHAQANVKTAHEQGTAAMVSVFIDTFIVLTMTALIVITSLYVNNEHFNETIKLAMASPEKYSDTLKSLGYTKEELVKISVASLFANASLGDKVGAIFVGVCLTFFAFSTIISWNLFGRINFEYLFGKKSIIAYSLIAILFVFLGARLESEFVWSLNDFFNYMMVFPNALALIALSGLVVTELKTNGKKSVGKTPNQALNEKI